MIEAPFQPPPSERKDATAARADSVRAWASESRVAIWYRIKPQGERGGRAAGEAQLATAQAG